jgi:NADH-quinone oxidoreductase subunit F
MQKSPHMLIEGIVIAAHAAGASRAFIYIRGEYEAQARILDAALAQAAAAGYIGEHILGGEFSCTVVLHRGAGAYICGEETGLLDSLEGKRGNPRLKPPFPAIQGLYQGPTLINNVETLCTVPSIIQMGGGEYAKIGTETSTGTKLVSVSGDVQRPGNYEIELGTPSREIIYELAGGPEPGHTIKLWFPGGSSSPVLTADDLDLAYDFDTMAKAGTMLGSGAIIVVDDRHRVLDVALKLAKFYSHESCGKCVPCREGTNWTMKMLQRMDGGLATPMDLDIMASVQSEIIGNCLCVLGDAMAMPVGSIVAKFRTELEAELEQARKSSRSPSRLRCADAAARAQADPDDDRRTRDKGDRGADAGRCRQARRRRDPVLLLRAKARPTGRRLPHVPGRDRGDPEAADLVLDGGQGRNGRQHQDRSCPPGPEHDRRVPARQPSARLPGVRQGR